MKILLVNDYGTRAGGAEVIVFGLRDALRARGHDVRVFTSSAKDDDEPLLADDRCFGTTRRWRTLLQCGNVSACTAIRRVIDRFGPDVIHVNLYLTQLSPLILPALADVASIYYAQWYRAICPLGTRLRPDGGICGTLPGSACLGAGCVRPWDAPPLMLQMALDGAWGGRFTRVAAISRAVAARLARFGAAHLRSAEVLYPGTPVVEPRELLAREPTAVFAGRLVPEKGVDVLLRAFARVAVAHRSARLVVIGDGPERPALDRLTGALGLRDRVAFRGRLSHADTLAALRDAWIVCVPSRWEEPFGMIAAEAQMHGVAVIASHAGGLAEIVEDGVTGHLVPPGDVAAIAARLDEVFSTRDTARSLGLAGHAMARERFSLDGFAARVTAIYRDAIVAHGDGS
jgi:glycosyltransferase involved in cell wall biosynthesis